MFVALFHQISIDSLEEVMEKSAACQRGKILLNSEMNSRDFQFCIRTQDGKKAILKRRKKENIAAGDVLPGHLGLKACRLGLCGGQLGVELLSQTLGSSDL